MHSHAERENDQWVPGAVDLALALAFDFDLLAPFPEANAGVAQGAPRQGCRGSRPRPWMADGGGPPEQCRSEGMPSLGEAPNGGAKPFGSFLAFEKGLAVRAKPPAAVTAETDMYPRSMELTLSL